MDPVLLALMQKQLDHITRQMGWVMMNTARSPIFSQSHDFSCFIGDADGAVAAQADGIPIHTGGGGFALRALKAAFGRDIADGDVFLSNDPYLAGNNHLADWTMMRPVFVDGELFGFSCNRAHQSDIGGGVAGTYNAAAREIFHEGVRIPPLRIAERGVMREDIVRLLLANTRCPDLLAGDLHAMLGSTKIGAERLAALAREVGSKRASRLFPNLLDYAERRMRAQISNLRPGRYSGADSSDHDCFGEASITVQVTLTVEGDRLAFDFSDSSPQIAGFKNSPLANTHSAVYLAVATFLDQSLPRNQGAYRAIEIIAPEGSIVNARPPAPVGFTTTHPAHEIITACWQALAGAAPDRSCAGWGKSLHPVSAGATAQGSVFVLYHWLGYPAAGAVAERDGFNVLGTVNTLGGLVLPNVEDLELTYPIEVRRQEFRTDGGGAGQMRGGTGVCYEARQLVPTETTFRDEASRRPSGAGVLGGYPGAAGTMSCRSADGTIIPTPAYGAVRCGPMELSIESAGGGGWGDPIERDPEAVRRDVLDEFVSPEAARTVYHVVLSSDLAAVDYDATSRARKKKRFTNTTTNTLGDRAMRNFAARAWAYTRCAGFAAAIVVIQAALGVSSAHAQNRNDTARVVWPFETSSLDPAGAGVQRSTWGVSWHIYDRLVSYALDEPRDKIQQYRLDKPRGDLAERWDISDDGRIYTFHLRRGAVFHDGSQLTAEDVRWSLQRAISLPTTRFVLNLGGLTSEDQIKVVDEATLTIALPKPNRYLLRSLSTPFAPIINARQVKPHVTAGDPWGGDWLKGNDAGSGAYQVTTFRPDQTTLERNDKWHGSPLPTLRWAVFQTVPEDTMRVALVERHLADIAIGLTPNAIEAVERRGQAQLLLIPMPNQFEFLVTNAQSKPFDDVRVRQALAHAIPQEEIFRSVFLGRGTRLFGGSEEAQGATFPQPQSFAYDPKRARDLLAEAGYPNGLDTTLSLCTCKAEYFENLAVALKDHLARVGIRVTIDKFPGARFGELQTAKQMPLYLENQVAWLNLPDYWIRIFYRGNTRSNFSGYANPALDALLAKADDATSDAGYDAAMREMIAIVNRDAPLLMFRQAALEVVIGKDIGNYAYWFHALPDVRSLTRN